MISEQRELRRIKKAVDGVVIPEVKDLHKRRRGTRVLQRALQQALQQALKQALLPEEAQKYRRG